MQFYKCATSPLTLARTQADAKGTGASFKPIDVDTSHKGLTAFFADLIAEVVGSLSTAAPERAPAAPPPVSDEEPAPAYTYEVTAGHMAAMHAKAMQSNTVIFASQQPATGPQAKVVEVMNATAAEEFIWSVDEDRLTKLEAVINERRKELALQAKVERSTIIPPVRARKRP